MYQPHNLLWFVAITFPSILLLVIAQVLRRWGRSRIPRLVPAVLGWVVMLELVLLIGVRAWDHSRLRAELRAAVSGSVSKVTLSHNGVTTRLTNDAEIAELRLQLQLVEGVMAHHSHPTDRWDVTFDSGGRTYHYRVAQDSQRRAEYWIFRVNEQDALEEDMGIGRVESARLGSFLAQAVGQR